LKQDLFRVRPMSEQRNGRHQNRENRHGDRYRSEARIVRPFPGMLVKFLNFVRHLQSSPGKRAVIRSERENNRTSSPAVEDGVHEPIRL
jgi:hypothetical protein